MTAEEDYDDEVALLYRKHLRRVLGFLLNLGTDGGLAEEIAADAFLGARRHWARVRTFDRPESYVYAIARNEWSKRQRKLDERARELHPGLDERLVPHQACGQDLAQDVADRAALRRALDQLPPREREAVALRHIEEFPEDVTATIMGISKATVRNYAYLGRQRLRPLLAEFRQRSEGTGR